VGYTIPKSSGLHHKFIKGEDVRKVDKMDEGEFKEGNAFREGGTVTVPKTVGVKLVLPVFRSFPVILS